MAWVHSTLGRRAASWGFSVGTAASVLMIAAAAKAWSLSVGDARSVSEDTIAAVAIAWEACLALWLFQGSYVRAARWTAIATFGVFSAVTLHALALGHATCGCFGARSTPQFMFGVDVGILVLLCLSGPELGRTCGRSKLIGAAAGGGLALFVVAFSGIGTPRTESTSTRVGSRWELMESVEEGPELDRGAWSVVLHRPSCDECERFLSNLRTSEAGVFHRIILVEITESRRHSSRTDQVFSAFPRATCRTRDASGIRTPAIVLLKDGIVLGRATPNGAQDIGQCFHDVVREYDAGG